MYDIQLHIHLHINTKKSRTDLVSYWKRLKALCIYDRSSRIASVLKFDSFSDEIPFNRHTHSFEPNRCNQNINRQKVTVSLGLIHIKRKASAKGTHIPKLAMVTLSVHYKPLNIV